MIVTFLTGYIALNVPNFGLFLSLLGSVTCNLLGFILPSYFHYYVTVQQEVDGRLEEEAKRGPGGTRLARNPSFAKTPVEDLFYCLFGISAGIWSFAGTLGELASGGG